MPTEFPILRLPDPIRSTRPTGNGGGAKPKLPTRERQTTRLGPQFNRLRTVLTAAANDNDAILNLRNDPSSIAPERAIVFEVAGDIGDFCRAAQRIPGLEYLGEDEVQFEPDQDFSVVDTREATKGEPRFDKLVGGRLYLAMPDLRALRELLSGWQNWTEHGAVPFNSAKWRDMFLQLRAIRPWGAQDRITSEVVEYWRERLRDAPGEPVRTEVELWFHQNAEARSRAFSKLETTIEALGGSIVHHCVIAEISYHASLVDIPAANVERLLADRNVSLALSDEVMYIRPQSVASYPTQVEVSEDPGVAHRDARSDLPPIAALLDGVPVQQHNLLADRLVIDDPDDLQGRTVVLQRVHGTAMASLILHGDLNVGDQPLPYKLLVHPLMHGQANGAERTVEDRLLLDLVYKAVRRIKEGDNEGEAIAPQVFIINLSMGDPRRPFAGQISPWGRLLDFLSHKYGVLFIVSAGNTPRTPIELTSIENWTAFEQLQPEEREKEVLNGLNASKSNRSLLSPAESLNSLTIGALHSDNLPIDRQWPVHSLDPFSGSSFPSIISAVGLGHRRVVKPDILMPGGRVPVKFQSATNGHLTVVPVVPSRNSYGLRAAAPDSIVGGGRLNCNALTAGTSASAALTTRAAHQIYNALFVDGGPVNGELDPSYSAVLVKALLAHNAKWGTSASIMENLFGPFGQGKHVERRENVARFLGLGTPAISDVCECAVNRATMIGYGTIAASPDAASVYRVPLPACLTGVAAPRNLNITLAWFSPINTRHQGYRCAKLEAKADDEGGLKEVFGVERIQSQPPNTSVEKGTIIHYKYSGDKVIPFIEQGQLALKIWCREGAGTLDGEVTYAFAVTIEAEEMLPVYQQIRDRLRAPVVVQH